jgi:acetyl esterase/lipase
MNPFTRRSFLKSAGAAAAIPAAVEAVYGQAAQAGQARGGQAGAPDLKIENDVVFGKGGDIDLQLDIYNPPAGSTKRMAVIHLHGGGFTGGSRKGVASSSIAFARMGYVSIASQYRLTGQGLWPAQIEDTKAAIRWVRANAGRLNIDPARIAIAGYSAGGLMALFAAGTQDKAEFDGKGGNAGVGTKLAAAVGFYPATAANAALMPAGSDQAARDAASATNKIGAGFAPTILLHGVADTTIPLESSLRFFEALRKANVPAELHLFDGVPHAFETNNPEFALASAQMADLFFDHHVINPRTFPPFGVGRGGGGANTGAGRGAGTGGGARGPGGGGAGQRGGA